MKNNYQRQIGVWLDHAKAHFIDLSKGPASVETAYSSIEPHERFEGETGIGTKLGNNRATNNENHQHNRRQEILDQYYEMLTDRLKNYEGILLLGSSTARNELYNRLMTDKHFSGKHIHVQPAEKLTENEMVAEVRRYFSS